MTKILLFGLFGLTCFWITFCMFTLLRSDSNAPVWSYYLGEGKADDDTIVEVKFVINSTQSDIEENFVPNSKELIDLISQELSNVPFEYWKRHERHMSKMRKNSTCASFASPFKLKFQNNLWQSFENENTTFQLFNAYFDKRSTVPKGPIVRILSMINQIAEPFKKTYCQLWFEEFHKPIIVEVNSFDAIWVKIWGYAADMFYPHLLSCQLPAIVSKFVPKTVSLVSQECATASNNLRVIYESAKNQPKEGIAVCVKGMDFPYADLSARMTEWLELLRMLGAHKVYAYNLAVHPNMQRVIDYYMRDPADSFLEVRPLTLANSQPATPHYLHFSLLKSRLKKRLNEIIPYNDCFYRNMYKYDHIALLDIDEIIMPLGNLTNWSHLLQVAAQLKEDEKKKRNCMQGFASICFRNVLFYNKISNESQYLEDIPKNMHMLQHIRRDVNHTNAWSSVKCFHNTDYVLTLHNHFTRARLKGCRSLTIPVENAQMAHYRSPSKTSKNNILLTDRSIWRFKQKLIERTQQVLTQLNLI